MSWIGGDLAGLQNMGTAMKSAPETTHDVVAALGSRVDKVAGDASWKGQAADAFRKAWTSTSIQVGALATTVASIGQTLGDVGDTLQQIEADLYNAAHAAKAQGAQIGDDGKPLPLVISGDPDSPEAQQARQAQQDYTATYASAIDLARGYRLNAAKTIAEAIEPIRPTTDSAFSWDKRITLADYLRGLYAVPNEKNSQWGKELPDKIKNAETALHKAVQDWRAAFDKHHAEGKSMPIDHPARFGHIEAVNDLHRLETKLAAAEAGKSELPLSNPLNTKLADMGKLAPELSKLAPKGLGFLADIPIVDVAASGVVAEFQARDDIQKGQSAGKARAQDYAAAGAGLAAGAGMAAAMAGAPVWGTALVAGGMVVGVGDAVYEGFHEHWSEDIHDRGVWGGLKYGTANTFSNTGDDIVDLGKSAWNAGTSLWHKIF
ncbi:WXG100 family type VII secretion target [Nocardia sp. NPDC051570]|uniref:WXG100 family type VII secretion target n=1 Tax=Nocardia sp. NPDC051570 TaxID=3364324 RepID=UPI0037A6BFD7